MNELLIHCLAGNISHAADNDVADFALGVAADDGDVSKSSHVGV
jgi:hypothetical protein